MPGPLCFVDNHRSMLDIVKRPLAELDLIVIASHIEFDAGPRVADRFLNAAENAFERLAFMPGIGVERTYGTVVMRMWTIPKFSNYLIFYTTSGSDLEIIRVLHGAQDLAGILDPDPNPSE